MNPVEPQPRLAEIERYLDEVRAALADLPEEVRDELLEDLPAHLAEVAAEHSEPLADRLGPPARYAAELRAAAGLDAPAGPAVSPRMRRLLTATGQLQARLRPLDARIGRLIGYERARDFLALLVPAWWVLRGYLVGMVVIAVFFGHVGVIPFVDGNWLIGALLMLVLVGASVRLGPIVPRLPVWLRVVARVVGVVAGLAIFVGLLDAESRSDEGPEVYRVDSTGQISDLYPYDAEGRPLTGVRIYDQDGNQITFGNPYRCRSVDREPGENFAYPLCPWPGAPGATVRPPVGPSVPAAGQPPSPSTGGQSPSPSAGGSPSATPSGPAAPATSPGAPAPAPSRS